jgi:hypothetical protein
MRDEIRELLNGVNYSLPLATTTRAGPDRVEDHSAFVAFLARGAGTSSTVLRFLASSVR